MSTQVLQEFYVTVTRKVTTPLAPAEAREVIRTYSAWDLQILGPDAVLRASDIGERHRLSFWDALSVTAAVSGRAQKSLSEDLTAGPMVEGVLIENPFAARSPRG